jgi:hypothetical protein
VLKEHASEARALASSGKNEARRTSIAPTKTPPTPNLTTHLGSGPGYSSPPQGWKTKAHRQWTSVRSWKWSFQRRW